MAGHRDTPRDTGGKPILGTSNTGADLEREGLRRGAMDDSPTPVAGHSPLAGESGQKKEAPEPSRPERSPGRH